MQGPLYLQLSPIRESANLANAAHKMHLPCELQEDRFSIPESANQCGMVCIQDGRGRGSPGIFLQQSKQVVQCGLDVMAARGMVRFDRHEALSRLRDSSAWFALSPAPAACDHQPGFIREHHLAWLRVIIIACAQLTVAFCSIG